MACGNGRGELERTSFVARLIGVDVDVSVVAATGQQTSALGPAQSIDTSVVAVQLIHNVQLSYPISVAIESFNSRVFGEIAKLALEQTIMHVVLHLRVLMLVDMRY